LKQTSSGSAAERQSSTMHLLHEVPGIHHRDVEQVDEDWPPSFPQSDACPVHLLVYLVDTSHSTVINQEHGWSRHWPKFIVIKKYKRTASNIGKFKCPLKQTLGGNWN